MSTDQEFLFNFSAGVGRTGAYICIDSMLERAQRLDSVDVFRFVSDMRKQRCKMVQTAVS